MVARRVIAVFLTVFLSACSGSSQPQGPPLEPLETYSLVFGGDVTLGRRFNEALHDEALSKRVFADIRDTMRSADLTLVNAEGVISGGGKFTDKGESRPHMYRAHPRAMEILVDAGVDVIAVGNNHSGDYGPLALTEMLDRTLSAGLSYTGAGVNLADASRPAYRTVGDTVIAFVGADLTITHPHAATATRPGLLWLPGMNAKKEDVVVSKLTEILARARRHAHLVFLTPHWGVNMKGKPSRLTRRLAKRLINAGYDGIFGHSAHLLQGAELIDGKPVLYDAGNLLSDYNPSGEYRRSMLFSIAFNQAGVTAIRAEPLVLTRNRVARAKGKEATSIIASWTAQSKSLGTSMQASDNGVELVCEPGATATPSEGAPVVRAKPDRIREAPANLIVSELPPWATPTSVIWANGIELVGYDLLMSELRVPKAGQVVTLYFKTSKPIAQGVQIHLDARRTDKPHKFADGGAHLPGDWVFPVKQWPVGEIVRDQTLVRLTAPPEGTITFGLGLRIDGKITPPTSSALDTLPTGLLKLGDSPYVQGAPKLWAKFEAR